MLEKDIERYARERCKRYKGVCLKFVSPGHSGVPDRLMSNDKSGPFLVELKRRNRKVDAHQMQTVRELVDAGIRVYIDVDSVKKAYEIIDHEMGDGPKLHEPVDIFD